MFMSPPPLLYSDPDPHSEKLLDADPDPHTVQGGFRARVVRKNYARVYNFFLRPG